MQRAAEMKGGGSEEAQSDGVADSSGDGKADGAAAGKGKKPGRNDPCWCGSGKKYKKCHLPIDERGARA
jgi:uncharacterized protein YchJ